MLVGLLGFFSALSQHRQPLQAGWDPAGPVQNQTQEEEEDGDERVAADGYHRGRGQSCRGLLALHRERLRFNGTAPLTAPVNASGGLVDRKEQMSFVSHLSDLCVRFCVRVFPALLE